MFVMLVGCIRKFGIAIGGGGRLLVVVRRSSLHWYCGDFRVAVEAVLIHNYVMNCLVHITKHSDFHFHPRTLLELLEFLPVLSNGLEHTTNFTLFVTLLSRVHKHVSRHSIRSDIINRLSREASIAVFPIFLARIFPCRSRFPGELEAVRFITSVLCVYVRVSCLSLPSTSIHVKRGLGAKTSLMTFLQCMLRGRMF